VPKTCRTLSMLAAVINNTSRMRLALEILFAAEVAAVSDDSERIAGRIV